MVFRTASLRLAHEAREKVASDATQCVVWKRKN
jgi:hypothetical protein